MTLRGIEMLCSSRVKGNMQLCQIGTPPGMSLKWYMKCVNFGKKEAFAAVLEKLIFIFDFLPDLCIINAD